MSGFFHGGVLYWLLLSYTSVSQVNSWAINSYWHPWRATLPV